VIDPRQGRGSPDLFPFHFPFLFRIYTDICLIEKI
jgi:hypothetical protein